MLTLETHVFHVNIQVHPSSWPSQPPIERVSEPGLDHMKNTLILVTVESVAYHMSL